MLRYISLICFMCFFFGICAFGNSVIAAESSEGMSQEINVGKYKLWGCFDKPCSIYPDEINIFGYSSPVKIVGFNFIGRTGEKTFDIEKANIDTTTHPHKYENKIFHVYFSANDLFYLFHTNPFKEQGCSDSDNIYLKMMNLKGNKLGFQIILPACLRKAQ